LKVRTQKLENRFAFSFLRQLAALSLWRLTICIALFASRFTSLQKYLSGIQAWIAARLTKVRSPVYNFSFLLFFLLDAPKWFFVRTVRGKTWNRRFTYKPHVDSQRRWTPVVKC